MYSQEIVNLKKISPLDNYRDNLYAMFNRLCMSVLHFAQGVDTYIIDGNNFSESSHKARKAKVNILNYFFECMTNQNMNQPYF